MKLKLFLALSVTLNILTAALLIASLSASPGPSVPTVAKESHAPLENVAPPPEPVRTAVAPSIGWVQSLHDAGIADKIIADVASANFDDRWHKLAEENQKKFDRGEIAQAALTRFDLEHDAEQEKELRTALGPEAYQHWDQTRVLSDIDRTGIQLSSDESRQLYKLRKDLDHKRLDLDLARHDAKITEADAASQNGALYAQYNQQLLKVLGNDRYAQIQNGGDTGIGQLKRNLHDVTTDDAQLVSLQTSLQSWYAKRSELELNLQQGTVTATDYQKQMKALENQRDQEYQTVLGANGFATFERNESEQYQTLSRISTDVGFSEDDVNNLYASLQEYQNSVNDYRDRAQKLQDQGQTVDWPAVEKALNDFSQQTESALRDKLGERFDKLKRSNILPFER